jgi:hypothetical protein
LAKSNYGKRLAACRRKAASKPMAAETFMAGAPTIPQIST